MYKKLTQLGIIIMAGIIAYNNFLSIPIRKKHILEEIKRREYSVSDKGIEDLVSRRNQVRIYAEEYFLVEKNKNSNLEVIFDKIQKEKGKVGFSEIIYYNALEYSLIKNNLKNMTLATDDKRSLAIQVAFLEYTSKLEKTYNIYEQIELLNSLLQIREDSEDRINYMIATLFKDIGDSLIANINIKNYKHIRRGHYSKTEYHIRNLCKERVDNSLVFLAASRNIEYKRIKGEGNKKLDIFFRETINRLLNYQNITQEGLKKSYKAYMLYLNEVHLSKIESKELFNMSLLLKNKANSFYKESLKFLAKVKMKKTYMYNRSLLLSLYSDYNTSEKENKKVRSEEILLKHLDQFIEKYPLDGKVMNIIMKQAYISHLTSTQLSREICKLYKNKLIQILDDKIFMKKYQEISSNKLYDSYFNKNFFISLSEYAGLVTRLDSVLKLLDADLILQEINKFEKVHIKYFESIKKGNIFLLDSRNFYGINEILKWCSRTNYRNIYPSVIDKSMRDRLLETLYHKIYETYVIDETEKYTKKCFLEPYSRIFTHLSKKMSRDEYLILGQILYDLKKNYNLLSLKEQKYFSFLYLHGQNYLYRRGEYQEMLKNYLSFRNIVHDRKILESYEKVNIEYSEVEFVAKSLSNVYNASCLGDIDVRENLLEDIHLFVNNKYIKYLYGASDNFWEYKETYLGKLDKLVK